MKKGEKEEYFCEDWHVSTATYQFNRIFSNYKLIKTFWD